MRAVTLGDVYVDACMAYGKVPNQGGLDAWDAALSDYQAQEIKQALGAWQANDEINDFTGRPFGAIMPAAAELKIIVLRARRDRRIGSRYCGSCRDGLVMTTYPGLDGRPERAVTECPCVRERKAAALEAVEAAPKA